MKRGITGLVPVPVPHAIIPLTAFDRLHERTTFVLGWLVEGEVDLAALESALTRVTRKWRMLAGRLESFKSVKKRWQLRVPIGEICHNYLTFTLSSATSDVTLSKYIPDLDDIKLPNPFSFGPLCSRVKDLFVHPSTPRGYAAFESRIHPLTCWHVTYFPASLSKMGCAYTCIGFSRCGILDDVGAGLILRALLAEMSGTPWSPPPLPNWGVNDNPLQRTVDREIGKFQVPLPGDREYAGYSPLTLMQLYRMAFWHKKQNELEKAGPRCHYLQSYVVAGILDEVRRALQEKGHVGVPVSDEDILFAWIIKTLYDSKLDVMFRQNVLRKRVAINNIVSFRNLFLWGDEPLENYPFNASIPMPCPILTIEEVSAFSVADIVRTVAAWQSIFSRTHVLLAYETLQNSTWAFPFNPAADETLLLADLTECQFAEMDWRHIGAWVTLSLSHFHLTSDNIAWTNAVCIIGKLADGSVLLDSILADFPLRKLEIKATNLQFPYLMEMDLEVDLIRGTRGARADVLSASHRRIRPHN